MADSTINTLAGIFNRLSGFTELTDIVGTRIYSNVPKSADFPYVQFTIENSDDYSSKNGSDYVHKLRVQGFSRKSTQLEALQIRQAVFNALDRKEANVTVTGATVVRMQKDQFATIFKQNDGVTWQSSIQFDIVVQTD